MLRSNFIRRLAAFSLGPIIAAFIGFLSVPLLTYLLVPDEFGKSIYYLTVQSIIFLLVLIGMDQAFVREYHAAKDKIELTVVALSLPLLLALLTGAGLVIFAGPASRTIFHSSSIAPIILLAISIPFLVVNKFFDQLIRMQERAKLYSSLQVLGRLVNVTLQLALLYFWRRDFIALCVADVLAQAALLILYFIPLSDVLLAARKVTIFNREVARKLLKFAWPLLLYSFLWIYVDSLDKLMISRFSSFNQLGLYAGAMKIVAVLILLRGSFCVFWTPTAYRWYEEGACPGKFEVISNGVASVFAIAFAVIVMSRRWVVLLLNAKYSAAQALFPMLLLVPYFYTVSETNCLGIAFSRRTFLNNYIAFFSGLTNLVVGWLLIPRLGAKGGAISIASCYFVFYALRTYFSRLCGFKIALKWHFFNCVVLITLGIIATWNQSPILEYTLGCLIVSANIWKLLRDYSAYRRNPGFA